MMIDIRIEVPSDEQLLFFIAGKQRLYSKTNDTHYEFQIETDRFPVALIIRRKTEYDTNQWVLNLVNPFAFMGYACFKRKMGLADAFLHECAVFSVMLSNPKKKPTICVALEKRVSNEKPFGTYYAFQIKRCRGIDLTQKEFSAPKIKRKWVFVRVFPPTIWLVAITIQICLGRHDWQVYTIGGVLLSVWIFNFISTVKKSKL